ncbi:amino acid adenylation domain-containing protein [Hwangdonia seohaensis]|uniref:Amino acid adenylation domain-containing protein n=1 Tax=Hwangdonia seohaensis TaxID=1240727 RepID=A0ABW3RBL8_9FLAO|nr:amino acid adenylation domain-containing protein [Hwangdonia seohaensis]
MHLTKSQFSIWMGQKLNPMSPLYNMAHTFDIYGAINPIDFKRAFKALIEQSDALRSVFYEIDGMPQQQSLPEFQYEMAVLDFSNLNTSEINNWIKTNSKKQFDLSKRTFETKLIRVNSNHFIWFLNIHHIVTDATSSTILFGLMSNLYKRFNENEHENLKPIPQFESYINFEAKHRSSQKSKEISAYWEEKIATLETAPILYGNKNNYSTTNAKRVLIELGSKRSKKLKSIAQMTQVRCWTQDLTLFNIFLSILFVYIYRISRQNKLAIGAPTHNRPSKNFKNTPGLFIEFFPLITDVQPNDTFLEVLQRVKLETNSYLRNAQPGMSNAALNKSYSVVLNFINANFSDFNGIRTQSQWIHPDHIDATHDLRCHVYNTHAESELSLFMDFNEAVFSAELCEKAPTHFLNVLDEFIDDINQPFQQKCLVTTDEKGVYVTKELQATNPYISILETFEKQVKNTPNAIALQYKNETLTYNGLNKKANRLAHYLNKQGVVQGDKIAIYNYRNSDYIISVLAVKKLGAAFVPIASNQPSERIDFIISNSNCAYVLTNNELKSNLDAVEVPIVDTSSIKENLANQSSENLGIKQVENGLAYALYTSGSTGNPKGVLISNKALSNYIFWAKDYYNFSNTSAFALCTSIGFDLTITSTFLPLISGGRIVVYKENTTGPDTAILDVIKDNLVDIIKLTPSHLNLFKDKDLTDSAIEKIIVGGEDFKVNLGISIKKAFGNRIKIFNEYGPTEATVGCIVAEFNPENHNESSVPIGVPISNMHAYILDEYKNLEPKGVIGNLYLSGNSLADGYLGLEGLTKEKFIDNPFVKGLKMYHTGDLARINDAGEYEYLGRVDEQVKLRGYRIELTDIESNLNAIDGIENCAVVLTESNKTKIAEADVINCTDCGLPSNYPNSDFDENGVCHLCNAFKGYKEKTEKYFKTEAELKAILTTNKGNNSTYDCLSLLSGGKDSTYILAQLVGMGLKVLAFTLDNGYISEQAIGNVKRIVEKLGVDHVFGTTEHMNAIFIDSLNRHKNVCNGCFKTIYTLSTKIALEKQIPFIVTGLSRGQFFETRLTEELFWDEDLDVKKIDDTILEVRKLYHREEDAVKDLLDVSMFEDDEVFDKVQFVDFYRYSDVSLEDMLKYLDEKVGWIRPTDTGRSTNCLINQVGIHVHKKEKGYSNYSFPYSWDVRLGHKTRDESLEEINEYIDEVEVKRIMEEIGYEESDAFENDEKLVAYYTGDASVTVKELKERLSKRLPNYMVPSNFKHLDNMPLTKNGKVDKKTLRSFNTEQLELATTYVAPRNEIDELIEDIWKDVLRLNKIGIHDNFIALGGHSLAAIRVTSRLNEELGMEIPLNKVFNLPTIKAYSDYLEQTMLELL